MSPLPLDQQKNPLVQSPEELERARLERESKTDTILKSRLIAEAERFIDANANDPKRVREFVEKLAVSAEGGPEALAELRRYRSSEALKMVHESREK